MLRILHVMPTLAERHGGPIQALVGLIRSTQGRVDSAILSLESPHQGTCRSDLFNQIHAHVHQFEGAGLRCFAASHLMRRWLDARIDDFDLLHLHGGFIPAYFFLTRMIHHKKPYLLRPLGNYSSYTFEHRNALLKRVYFNLFENKIIRGAAALHLTSPLEFNTLAPCVDSLNRPLFVFPLPFEQTPAMRDKPSIKSTDASRDPVVVFLSRIDPKKGLETLVDALKILAEKRRRFEFRIAGEGRLSYVKEIKNRIDRSGIGDRVHFLGHVSGGAKAEVFKNSDVFVLMSHHENYGFAVAEALSFGVPVVVSDQVGLGDWVASHGAGKVIRNDSHELARVLDEMLNNPAAMQRMGESGIDLVRKELNYESIGAKVAAMYESVVRDWKLRSSS